MCPTVPKHTAEFPTKTKTTVTYWVVFEFVTDENDKCVVPTVLSGALSAVVWPFRVGCEALVCAF